MENGKTKVAFIRGDSLNEWEAKVIEKVSSCDVTFFCSEKNLYPTENLVLPIKKLPSTADSRFSNIINQYTRGIFQRMEGLEQELNNYDIAHTAELYYYYTYQAVLAKKNNPKLKVVTTIWDNSIGRFEFGLRSHFPFWKNKIYRMIEEVIQGVDVFLPVSKSSEDLLKHYGVEDKKIHRLMPAVTSYAQNVAVSAEKKNTFLMVNRLVKEKGVHDVLAAWKMFVEGGARGYKLMIVGSGPEKKAMEETIKKWSLQDSVTMVGTLPYQEVRALYPQVRGLVLASIPTPVWQEQFGFVLAEALLSDCPVISTTTGAIPEVVGKAGILVSPSDKNALADALNAFTDPAKYHELVMACQTEKEKFSPDHFISKITKIYESR